MVDKIDETNKTDKSKPERKRKSQGWRTHIRRLKQAGRKAGTLPAKRPRRKKKVSIFAKWI
jgi:hypothetical protein